MKIFYNVRSTTEKIPALEVNLNSSGAIDTVYVRSDITVVDGTEGREKNIGMEIQYSGKKFIEVITQKNAELEEEVADVWFDNMVLDAKIEEEASALWFEIMQGGV